MTYRLTLPTGAKREARRVTEVIRAGMPRPAVHEWEIKGAVAYALANGGGDTKATLAAFRKENRKNADRGTAVHRWIAAILKGEPPPALLASQAGYGQAFTSWMVDHAGDQRYVHVEQKLAWHDYSVAGTADLIGHGILVDWKTVATPKPDAPIYPDQLAQLGAYSLMRWLVDDDTRVLNLRPPEVEEARVVRLHPDGTYQQIVIAGSQLTLARALFRATKEVADCVHRFATQKG